VSSEFVGVLQGGAEAAGNFPVGSAELTNMLTPHGQAVSVWERASYSDLAPERLDGLLFMWETQLPVTLTSQAAQAARVFSNGYDQESGKNTYQRHFSP
jgi:homogentisate 1,2-dioxygenase